ncbi:unnamed protein product [Diabrotica balteata]|uniref:Uncharacterized protein n=1 Tax=Diabrotica balteata TaxID=107213 RepID=A0A9N9XKW3_DIABA|nr:unnamed protein product [Diabrotica balteata]
MGRTLTMLPECDITHVPENRLDKCVMPSRGCLFVGMALQKHENKNINKDSSNISSVQSIPLHDTTNSLEFNSKESNQSSRQHDKSSFMPGNENVLPENSIYLNETPTISNENTYNHLCLPSTSNIVNMDQRKNYYISPIRSNESDIDDSDADPNFDVSPDKSFSNRLIPTTNNSSASSSSSSSLTSSDSSDNASESTVSNIGDNGEKKGKKKSPKT